MTDTKPQSSQSIKRLPAIGTPAAWDLLWSYRKRDPTVLNIFRAARAAAVYRSRTPRQRLGVALRLLGWVSVFPMDLIKGLFRWGRPTKRVYHRGYASQLRDLVQLAFTSGMRPLDYYMAGLGRFHGGPTMLNVVPHRMFITVLRHSFQYHLDRAPGALLRDKATFESLCHSRGVASVRSIAVARKDGLKDIEGALWTGTLPARDLILKPVDLSQGEHIERWLAEDDLVYADGGGQRLTAEELVVHARQRAEEIGRGMLIQPCLRNHSELVPLLGERLSTLRCVSCLNEDGEPEIVEIFLRTLASADAVADNQSVGGIHFPVGITSGRIGTGADPYLPTRQGWHDVHPATGVRISGCAMPLLEQATSFVRSAHLNFSEYHLIGWDVALTPDGPLVVEASVSPGTDPITQSWLPGGLIGSRYGQLVAHHAMQVLHASEPEGSRWRIGADS